MRYKADRTYPILWLVGLYPAGCCADSLHSNLKLYNVETQKELVVLSHKSISDYKASHNNNKIEIYNTTDKNGVKRTFFTCGSTVGAISKNVTIPIAPTDRVQIITVQGKEGPLDIIALEKGLEPSQVL